MTEAIAERPASVGGAPGALSAAAVKRRFPETLLVEDFPAHRRPRLVTAMPNVPLMAALSGITYHLALAGMRSGDLDGCFSMYRDKSDDIGATLLGGYWKAMKRLSGASGAGYKFSTELMDYLWARHADALTGADLIHNFQMTGRRLWRESRRLDIRSFYYIDGTLDEYFETYGPYDVSQLDAATRKSAIAHEREGYLAAQHVIVSSLASAASMRDAYGVPDDRVSIVLPSANLSAEHVAIAEALPKLSGEGEFNVGFLGLYPERKGLDRLTKAVQICRGRGLPIRMTVVGKQLDWMAGLDWVTFEGRINKHTEPERFIRVLKGFDLGCQLSLAELGGIALCEYLRLGIPVLGTTVGGATDILSRGGAIQVPFYVTPEELAEHLTRVVEDRAYYDRLSAEAYALRAYFDSARMAAEIAQVVEAAPLNR